MPLVSFVTDYGRGGGFVGALHGVVDAVGEGRIAVVDVDHDVPRHDVLLGALRLERSLADLRPGVHVGIVDPGVGSGRRNVALQCGDRLFVGPDNGLLVFAAARCGGTERAVLLDEPRYFAPGRAPGSGRSATFDGRDVFAPVAAHLALGTDFAELGPALDPAGLVSLERPSGYVVVQVDSFGNVQFAAEARELPEDPVVEVRHREHTVEATVGGTFADVPVGAPVLLVDSDGAVALSVNQGRADDLLGLAPGDRVEVVGTLAT